MKAQSKTFNSFFLNNGVIPRKEIQVERVRDFQRERLRKNDFVDIISEDLWSFVSFVNWSIGKGTLIVRTRIRTARTISDTPSSETNTIYDNIQKKTVTFAFETV